MDIGFCGTGRMGSAMVLRLIEQGHRLTVWNRTAAKAAALLEQGARWAASPAELAQRHDTVISILTDARAAEAVYGGGDGLLSRPVAGRLFIEMSTLLPEDTRRLAARAAAKGAALLECPVGGTIGPAREGKLLGLAAGDGAAFARARPLLEQLCRRVDYLGPSGCGAAMKLAINLPLAVYWEALREAVTLIAGNGIDIPQALAIFQESSGGANALKSRAAKIVTALAGGAPDVGFDIDGVRKDLRLMAEAAARAGIELPLAAKALEGYDAAAAEGWGGRDASSLVAWRAGAVRR
ncbi:MAG TPA: NAD(P)-dependent oxidoreductase [Stellaceae bacterium]|nr:NAD(P)-dependent oxidoreductase [Stellaceae bacterium]